MSRRGRGRVLLGVLVLVATLVGAGAELPARADDHGAGDLDTTFDDDGVATTAIPSGLEVVDAERQQLGDGTRRLLTLVETGFRDYEIWAFAPDGTLDTSFQDDGVLPLDGLVPEPDDPRLAVDDAGRIVVAMRGSFDLEEFWTVAVLRLDPDGTVDEGFGVDGVALVDDDVPQAETLLPAACAGEPAARTTTSLADVTTVGGAVVLALVGEVDALVQGEGSCFSVEDVRASPVLVRLSGRGELERVVAAALPGQVTPSRLERRDGGVVLSASQTAQAEVGTVLGVAVVDVDADLDLGSGFGGAGWSSSPLLLTDDEVDRSSLLPVPLALAGGAASMTTVRPATGPNEEALALAHVRADGTPGTALTALPEGMTSFDVDGLGVTPDGLRVVTGVTGRAEGGDRLGVVRYELVEVDTGGEFPVEYDQPEALDLVEVPTVDPPGGDVGPGVLAGGLRGFRMVRGLDLDEPGYDTQALGVLAMDREGVVDDGFGADGTGTVVHRGGRVASAGDVGVLADGRIVAGGHLAFDGGGDSWGGFVLRHEEVGPLDGAFSPGPRTGVELTEGVSSVFSYLEEPISLVVEGLDVDAEARPVVVGGWDPEYTGGSGPGVIGRLTVDGARDPSFGGDGIVEAFVGDAGTELHDVVVDPVGRIVAVGTARLAEPPEELGDAGDVLVVLRRRPDGTADPSFGGDGVVLLSSGGADLGAEGRAVTIDAAGRVVVTGVVEDDPDGDRLEVLVARLDDDGQPDPDFGIDPRFGDGVRILDVDVPGDHVADDVAAVGNGVVVAGFRRVASSEGDEVRDAFLWRLRADGQPAGAFDGDGLAYPFAEDVDADTIALGVDVDAVGRPVVVGSSVIDLPPPVDEFPSLVGLTESLPVDLLVARVVEDGSLDDGFGQDGIVTTDLGLAGGEQAEDVEIAPDGKIVVAGHVTTDQDTRALVARYLPGEADLECAPDPADAGGVELGDERSVGIRCTALDDRVAVDGLAIDPASPDAAAFSLDPGSCVAAVLDADESCLARVAFAPADVGAAAATLQVAATTATGTLDLDVALRGRGLALRGQPGFAVAPDPLVFQERLLTTTSALRRVTVTNIGDEPLDVADVDVVGVDARDVAIRATTCTTSSVPAGATCTVDVAFTPRLRQDPTRGARLRFEDSAVGSPHVVRIRGRVTQPTLVVDPTEGPIGTEVEASGSGFAPGVPVRLRIAGTSVASVVPGSGGGFDATFEVPPGTPGGPRRVVACQRCGTSSDVRASTRFTVTPRLFVSPEIGPPGMVPEVVGDGFVPDDLVALRWDRGIGGVPIVPDDLGEFRTSMLVFHRDLLGTRVAGAVTLGDPEPVAEADFLVVPGSAQPGDFLVRR